MSKNYSPIQHPSLHATIIKDTVVCGVWDDLVNPMIIATLCLLAKVVHVTSIYNAFYKGRA